MGEIQLKLDESQLEAVEAACDMGDAIITGGAGTGKTTIIKTVADQMEGRVEIMAPTGKAAARLKEATGYPASTIHRALLWDGEKINRQSPFTCTVIVDETSMIDAWLLAQMLKFNPPKLLLVGDAAQLPPVGKGQPFHDLIKLRPDMVVELKHCWRAQGAVHKAAQAIRQGQAPLQVDNSGGESWRMINTGEAEATTAKLIEWVKSKALDFTQDIILSPTYGNNQDNDGGIDSINRAIRAIVNPSPQKFTQGDRVLCCKNFSAMDLWNGDLGTAGETDIEGNLWITLDRDPNPKLCEKEQLRELKHAYCLSVHKAQGSQFRRVVFICLRKHWYQLDRSLIYTAITRAQKGVCVIGELQAFYHGINMVKSKTTCLQILGGKKLL
jgi:exodeoxyribonuclease V alpha subunit